jgi:mRNA-degrading endonuclease RelE of RelBE toxin-antitoxin system
MKALTFTVPAIKDLKSVPKKDAKRIVEKLESLAKGEQVDVHKLQGADLYRLRQGNWRAVLAMTDTEITVARVLNRRDAYRS